MGITIFFEGAFIDSAPRLVSFMLIRWTRVSYVWNGRVFLTKTRKDSRPMHFDWILYRIHLEILRLGGLNTNLYLLFFQFKSMVSEYVGKGGNILLCLRFLCDTKRGSAKRKVDVH